MKRLLFLLLSLLIIACSSRSTAELERLCTESYRLEKKIRASRQAGGNDPAAVAAWVKINEQLKRYPHDDVYHAFVRTTGAGR